MQIIFVYLLYVFLSCWWWWWCLFTSIATTARRIAATCSEIWVFTNFWKIKHRSKSNSKFSKSHRNGIQWRSFVNKHEVWHKNWDYSECYKPIRSLGTSLWTSWVNDIGSWGACCAFFHCSVEEKGKTILYINVFKNRELLLHNSAFPNDNIKFSIFSLALITAFDCCQAVSLYVAAIICSA